jgi:pSer/pThr/pTyr-binding forkhead associated (FHA) protein
MKSQLSVISGQDSGEQFQRESHADAIIGRGIECDIRLHDPSVSRKHCRIVVENDKFTLFDADSRWGTVVNGKPVTCQELKLGDQLSIGETVLRLEAATAPDATTMARPESRQRRRASLKLEPLPAAVSDPQSGVSPQVQASAAAPSVRPSQVGRSGPGQGFKRHAARSHYATG